MQDFNTRIEGKVNSSLRVEFYNRLLHYMWKRTQCSILFILRRISTSHAVLHSTGRCCLSMCGNENLHRIVLCCATLHENDHDLATVGTSKEKRYLRAFGWNKNWPITWEHDRDPIYSSYFGEKYFEKKDKVPRKRRHWVTPLFKNRDIPLLNNGVTQWRRFHRTLGFFSNVPTQKVELACASMNTNFFSTNKLSIAPFCSFLRCSLWCDTTWLDFVRLVETHLYRQSVVPPQRHH